MVDPTEQFRRNKVKEIQSRVESEDEAKERERLEAIYGEVWNTEEVQEVFKVLSFLAPYCNVIRRSDGAEGTLEFQHLPRFYYDFVKG